jgi:hypothetical protein
MRRARTSSEQPDAERSLEAEAADRNAPAIARAVALTELASHVSPSNISLARTGLSDRDPMVRIGANHGVFRAGAKPTGTRRPSLEIAEQKKAKTPCQKWRVETSKG